MIKYRLDAVIRNYNTSTNISIYYNDVYYTKVFEGTVGTVPNDILDEYVYDFGYLPNENKLNILLDYETTYYN